MIYHRLAIDTNAYSDWQRGICWGREFDLASHLYVPFVVVGELLGGFARGAQSAVNRERFVLFLRSSFVTILYANEETPERYAQIYAALQAIGCMIPTNDIWIASICLQHGLPLATSDAHFSQVPLLERVLP